MGLNEFLMALLVPPRYYLVCAATDEIFSKEVRNIAFWFKTKALGYCDLARVTIT